MLRRMRRYKEEYLALLVLAGPIIVGQVAQVATGFTDTVMAGRLGPEDLAAIAVGVNLWIPILLFCIGIMMAVSSMVSHYYGAGQGEDIKDLMRQALLLAAALGLGAMLVVRALAGLLGLLQIDPAVSPIAAEYIRAVSWGMPAVAGYLALRFMSEGIGFTRPMMVIQLIGLAFNVVGNYILMFGKFGVPAMGAVGAGWATAIVMWLNLFMLMGYISVHARFRVIRRYSPGSWEWRRLGEMLRLGIPIALALLSEVGMFAGVALLMGRLGVIEVAAHQVAFNFASIMFMIPLGISSATTIRVGHAMGAGSLARARFRGTAGISLAGLCMLGTASVMLVFPQLIVSIYTDDMAVRQMAVSLLLMAAVFQLSDGIQVAAAGALRGLKDTVVPMLAIFVIYWLFGLPLSYFLGFTRAYGPQGLWFGLIASLTVAAIWLVWRFLRMSRSGATGPDALSVD